MEGERDERSMVTTQKGLIDIEKVAEYRQEYQNLVKEQNGIPPEEQPKVKAISTN